MSMFLTTQAPSQPDVCKEHHQCYLASTVSAKISFFSDTQYILNIRTAIHGPAQVDNYFIRTDIRNFHKTTRDAMQLNSVQSAAYCYRPSSVVCRSVCLSVCLSHSWAPQKRLNPSRYRLGCGLKEPYNNSTLANLANNIEPSMCGGNEAFYQTTLSICSCKFQTFPGLQRRLNWPAEFL